MAQSRVGKDFQPFLTRGDTTWGFTVGARVNNFDWNIASDATGTATPNILSELEWRDVVLLEGEAEIRHEEPLDIFFIEGGLHLEGSINAGLPVSGENQDSDFNGDDRTDEFSRTIADTGGYSVGGKAAVGYRIYLTGDPSRRAVAIARNAKARRERKAHAIKKATNKAIPAITMTPLAGYSVQQQRYSMSDVVREIPAGGILGVRDFDAHYLATWYGPFIGLEADISGKKNMVRLRGEYHYLDFYGEGFWRGRTVFRQDPSYKHEANGDGFLMNAEYAYALDDDYALTVDAMYNLREAEYGIDRTYFVDNDTALIRLNEVNDESYALRLGLRYDW